MTATPIRERSLVAAYHLIFDVKDTLKVGSDEFQRAADSLRALADLMKLVGVEPPERFDVDRTPRRDAVGEFVDALFWTDTNIGCHAETSGEGYWTCDVRGGCPGCRELARSLDDDEQIAEWQEQLR